MNVWHVWGNSNCQSRQIKDGKFDIVSIFADETLHSVAQCVDTIIICIRSNETINKYTLAHANCG